MTCVSCQTSSAPYELRDGRCLDCISRENTLLKIVLERYAPSSRYPGVLQDMLKQAAEIVKTVTPITPQS